MGVFRRRLRRSRSESDEGAILVEFVLALPILIIFIVGVMEMSWLTLAFSETWTAAREGARFATTVGDLDGDGTPNSSDCDDIRDIAAGRISVNTPAGADIDVTYLDPDANTYDCQGGTLPPAELPPGTQITVRVTGTYSALGIPFVGDVFDGLGLDSTSTRTLQSGWEF